MGAAWERSVWDCCAQLELAGETQGHECLFKLEDLDFFFPPV